VLDGAGEILAEAGVEEVIIVSDVETGFGKEVGEILFEILIDGVKTGPGSASFDATCFFI